MYVLENIANTFTNVGNDIKNLIETLTPTKEGQVLTAKMVDGQLKAVWSDPVSTPVNNTDLVFSELTNCTYNNGVLNYTGETLPTFDGYLAVTNKPKNISFIYPDVEIVYLFIGENNSIEHATDSDAEGAVFILSYVPTQQVCYINNRVSDTFEMVIESGDVMEATISNSTVTLTNKTKEMSYTTPTNDYLTKPKYLGMAVFGTLPLTIKAL